MNYIVVGMGPGYLFGRLVQYDRTTRSGREKRDTLEALASAGRVNIIYNGMDESEARKAYDQTIHFPEFSRFFSRRK